MEITNHRLDPGQYKNLNRKNNDRKKRPTADKILVSLSVFFRIDCTRISINGNNGEMRSNILTPGQCSALKTSVIIRIIK